MKSLADRFVFIANEVAKINDGVDNENPHRYPIRKMKMTAEQVISNALDAALEIAEAARILKSEIEDMDARNQP